VIAIIETVIGGEKYSRERIKSLVQKKYLKKLLVKKQMKLILRLITNQN